MMGPLSSEGLPVMRTGFPRAFHARQHHLGVLWLPKRRAKLGRDRAILIDESTAIAAAVAYRDQKQHDPPPSTTLLESTSRWLQELALVH